MLKIEDTNFYVTWERGDAAVFARLCGSPVRLPSADGLTWLGFSGRFLFGRFRGGGWASLWTCERTGDLRYIVTADSGTEIVDAGARAAGAPDDIARDIVNILKNRRAGGRR